MANQIFIDFVARFKKKPVEDSLNSIDKKAEKVGSSIASYLKAGFLAVASGFVVGKIKDAFLNLTNAAKDFETQMIALRSTAQNTGQDFEVLKQDVLEFSRDGVVGIGNATTAMQLLLSNFKAVSKEKLLDFSQSVKQLAALENVVGSTGQAFQDSIKGIITNSAELIENASPRFRTIARNVGGISDITTNAAKQQQFFNAVIAEGAKVQDGYNEFLESAAGSSARLDSEWQKLKITLGQFLLPLFAAATNALTGLVRVIGEAIESLQEFFKSQDQVNRELFAADQQVRELTDSAAKLLKVQNRSAEENKKLIEIQEALRLSAEKYGVALDQNTTSLKEQIQEIRKLDADRAEGIRNTIKVVEAEKERLKTQIGLGKRIKNLNQEQVRLNESRLKASEEELKRLRKTLEELEGTADKSSDAIVDAFIVAKKETKILSNFLKTDLQIAIININKQYETFKKSIADLPIEEQERQLLLASEKRDALLEFELKKRAGLNEEAAIAELKAIEKSSQEAVNLRIKNERLLLAKKVENEKLTLKQIKQLREETENKIQVIVIQNEIKIFKKRLELYESFSAKVSSQLDSITGAIEGIEQARIINQEDVDATVKIKANLDAVGDTVGIISDELGGALKSFAALGEKLLDIFKFNKALDFVFKDQEETQEEIAENEQKTLDLIQRKLEQQQFIEESLQSQLEIQKSLLNLEEERNNFQRQLINLRLSLNEQNLEGQELQKANLEILKERLRTLETETGVTRETIKTPEAAFQELSQREQIILNERALVNLLQTSNLNQSIQGLRSLKIAIGEFFPVGPQIASSAENYIKSIDNIIKQRISIGVQVQRQAAAQREDVTFTFTEQEALRTGVLPEILFSENEIMKFSANAEKQFTEITDSIENNLDGLLLASEKRLDDLQEEVEIVKKITDIQESIGDIEKQNINEAIRQKEEQIKRSLKIFELSGETQEQLAGRAESFQEELANFILNQFTGGLSGIKNIQDLAATNIGQFQNLFVKTEEQEQAFNKLLDLMVDLNKTAEEQVEKLDELIEERFDIYDDNIQTLERILKLNNETIEDEKERIDANTNILNRIADFTAKQIGLSFRELKQEDLRTILERSLEMDRLDVFDEMVSIWNRIEGLQEEQVDETKKLTKTLEFRDQPIVRVGRGVLSALNLDIPLFQPERIGVPEQIGQLSLATEKTASLQETILEETTRIADNTQLIATYIEGMRDILKDTQDNFDFINILTSALDYINTGRLG
jgi:hypothetical protein